MPVTGSIGIKLGPFYYMLRLVHSGWMAADMVQYIDDILEAADKEVAILKLLGYTMEVSQTPPSRRSDHWVEVDLENQVLTTNSDLIRKAVDEKPPEAKDPYSPLALRRVHRVLDDYGFTVKLVS